MSAPVVTRFAPSPTGYLHIGGLRTALFSYLMAKKHGGKFILRVEDTDQSRLVEDSVKDIEDSLKWAGLEWDEGPIFQSKRLEIYQDHAQKLLSSSNAYRCFCSSERLSEVREKKKANKENPGYDRKCRDIASDESNKRASDGEKFVVRLKMPLSGSVKVHDLVRGVMDQNVEQLEDIIILKSDGFPTYHLAHVVDDTLMGVTQVFRGTEWIPTSPMHAFMCEALDFPKIEYVHLPLILSPDGGKLSKRHGATNVKEFIEKGYTKEGLINFLALLGWSLDDRTEFFTLEDLEKVFDPKRISKSAAVFSYEKLNHFNNHYIKETDLDSFAKQAEPFINPGGAKLPLSDNQLKGLIGLYRDRIDTIGDLYGLLAFATTDRFSCPPADQFEFKKTTLEATAKALNGVVEIMNSIDWTLDSLNQKIDQMAADMELKKHHIFMPMRMAIAGTTSTPSITDICIYLGKSECVKRIDAALAELKD